MKNLKIKVFSLAIVTLLFSCTQNTNDILDQNEATNLAESTTAKTIVEGVKTHLKSDGTFINAQNPSSSVTFDFGFDFVYPITLKYNNGTSVVVNDILELAIVASGITTINYINGIAFPFTIKKNDGTNETINNEADFETIINSYDIDNDGIPNYIDTDDDNDGVLDTQEDENHDGDFTNDDSDDDGTPDYNDADSDDGVDDDNDDDNDDD